MAKKRAWCDKSSLAIGAHMDRCKSVCCGKSMACIIIAGIWTMVNVKNVIKLTCLPRWVNDISWFSCKLNLVKCHVGGKRWMSWKVDGSNAVKYTIRMSRAQQHYTIAG